MTSQATSRAHADALRAIKRANGAKRFRTASRTLFISVCFGAAAAALTASDPDDVPLAAKWTAASIITSLVEPFGTNPPIEVVMQKRTYRVGVRNLTANTYVRKRVANVGRRAVAGSFVGLLAAVALLFAIDRLGRKRRASLLGVEVLNGTRIVSEGALAKHASKSSNDRSLTLGSVPIPIDLETRHLAIAGTTGSGKTTALRQMLDAIERRGEAALVYDTSGDFIQHYYNPARGDVILNPFDRRGAFWNPFAEISHPADADRIARYLITETGERDRDVWLETSRILVANILRSLWTQKRCTLPDLLDALQSMSREEMEKMVANTSSARTFAKDADRATASVLFMLAKATNLLMFLRAEPREGERGFSFARFFQDHDKWQARQRWIFVPRKEDYFDAVKPLMALWLECAASGVLGMSPSPNRRIWFLLDEIADLPRVDNLARLLPEGRKFGAAVTLTFQSIGQIHNRYGRERGEAMLGCCNTKLFLQLIDQQSREWASGTIGTVEVAIPTLTDALDPKSGKVTTTRGTTRQVRAAVLESELRLPRYTAYLVFPDNMPVARIQLTDDHIHARISMNKPRFVPVDPDVTLWGRQKDAGGQSATVTMSFTSGPV
jgi:type IV secretory pathway TraG/TraD family ATPase VirD4